LYTIAYVAYILLRPALRTGWGAFSVDDVCLSVRPSVTSCTDVRRVWKLPNQSTWKFRTVLGPRKSITGCSIMTSSQIQDGGRPLIWKSLCWAYLSDKWSDYDEIWCSESDSDYDKKLSYRL